MAELITKKGRKAIKRIAEISHLVWAIDLMPTGEEFVLRLIEDLVKVAKRVNSITTRMNDMLDRYSSIPGEFLLEGFDKILDKLNDINDYAKFAISETTNVLSSTVSSVKDMQDAMNSTSFIVASSVMQIGGGISYVAGAMGANLDIASNGKSVMSVEKVREDVMQDVLAGKIPVADMEAEVERRCAILAAAAEEEKGGDSEGKAVGKDFLGDGEKLDNALTKIDNSKEKTDALVDNTVSALIEKVENAKKKVDDAIEQLREWVDKMTKDFDSTFGGIYKSQGNVAEHISNTARNMDTPVFDAAADLSDEVVKFIENFSIGKIVSAFSGMVIGAGVATVTMDLLPSVNVDRMLKNVIGGVDIKRVDKLSQLYHDKYYGDGPDLGTIEVPDSVWRLSEADVEKYAIDDYKEYLKQFEEENDKYREEMSRRMQAATTKSELRAIRKQARKTNTENYRRLKENDEVKSALKEVRKIRRNVIKAKQIERYKDFLKTEIQYFKRECNYIKTSMKNDWDSMMSQYTRSVKEIKKFFSEEGYGGNESIDRCCDRINTDADQIVDLCKSLAVELTNTVAMVPIPYSLGGCFDMPVHKVLSFFKDIKIIFTFLKNLIILGIDIISQMSILAKIIANGIQSIAEIMNSIQELIGVDKILNMIEFLVSLFIPKMVDAKILLENSLSPVYYNETEEYEQLEETMDELLKDDGVGGGTVGIFRASEDKYNKDDKYYKKYGGIGTEDDILDWSEALEAKGDEIVAYRSPILNDAGDDFAGWKYYYAYAYDYMKSGWSDRKKRRKNRIIAKAAKKNKMRGRKLKGGVAQLKKKKKFGYYNKDGKYIGNSVSGYDAYYWYTKWTNDPTDCDIDMTVERGAEIVTPVQTTENGSLVKLNDGRMVFVKDEVVKSGDFVTVNGVKYKVG